MDREAFLEVAKTGRQSLLGALESTNFFHEGMAVFRAEQVILFKGASVLLEENEAFLDQVRDELILLKLPELAKSLADMREFQNPQNQDKFVKVWKRSRRRLYWNTCRWLFTKDRASELFYQYPQFFENANPPKNTGLMVATKTSSLVFRYGQGFEDDYFLWLNVFFVAMFFLTGGPQRFIEESGSPLYLVSFFSFWTFYAWQNKLIRLWVFPVPLPPSPDLKLTEWNLGLSRENVEEAVELDVKGLVACLSESSSESKFLCWQAMEYVSQSGLRSLFEEKRIDIEALTAECELLGLSKLQELIEEGKALAEVTWPNRVKQYLAWDELRKKWNEVTLGEFKKEIQRALRGNTVEIFDRYPRLFESTPFVPGTRTFWGD